MGGVSRILRDKAWARSAVSGLRYWVKVPHKQHTSSALVICYAMVPICTHMLMSRRCERGIIDER